MPMDHEIALAIKTAVDAAEKEGRLALDKVRDDLRSALLKLGEDSRTEIKEARKTIITVTSVVMLVVGAMTGLLTFLGLAKAQENAIISAFERKGVTDLTERAKSAARDAEKHASESAVAVTNAQKGLAAIEDLKLSLTNFVGLSRLAPMVGYENGGIWLNFPNGKGRLQVEKGGLLVWYDRPGYQGGKGHNIPGMVELNP